MPRLIALTALLLAASGCDRMDRPMRPLPEQFFQSRTLDGRTVDRAYLTGKPWIVNLWVPG